MSIVGEVTAIEPSLTPFPLDLICFIMLIYS